MFPKDITRDIIHRLTTVRGQIDGIIRMIETSDDPEKIITQYKSVIRALDKSYNLLLDEVFRKALASQIVEAIDNCPGNCGNEEKIERIKQKFPQFTMEEVIDKLKETIKISEEIKKYREKH